MEQECFYYKTIKGEFEIPLKHIYRFQAVRVYTIIHTVSGSDILSKHLKSVERQLKDCPLFFRVDKSHIINMEHIKEFRNGTSCTLITKDGFTIRVARRRRKVFVKKYYKRGKI